MKAKIKLPAAVAVESLPTPFVFHTSEEIKRKGKIVKRRITYTGQQVSNNSMRIGKATCSLKEQFSRKKGRSISKHRAINAPEDILYLTDDTTPVKQFIARAIQLTKKYKK